MTIYFATFILSQVALFSCFQQETLSAKVVPFYFLSIIDVVMEWNLKPVVPTTNYELPPRDRKKP
jgi:hypothetical protein